MSATAGLVSAVLPSSDDGHGTAVPAAAVRTQGLTKRFRGGQLAVDAIDLDVPTGAVYGFLGPNGSGKTTTIRTLLGLISATSGTVTLLGEPMPRRAADVLPRVGALVEGPAFHPYLSGRANLARLDAADRTADPRTATDRIDAALHRVGLAAAAGKRYRAYSLGMRQRLGIAGALLQPRELLILDEPTNGLDPQGTREVRHLIGHLGTEGVTVLVSSHLLSEVEQVCTHVGVMSVGRLVWQGRLGDLSAQQQLVRVHSADPAGAVRVLSGLDLADVRSNDAPAEEAMVTAELGPARPEDVLRSLVTADIPVRGFAVSRPSLEERFVSLTGEGFDVSE